jgi:hypothetical protein
MTDQQEKAQGVCAAHDRVITWAIRVAVQNYGTASHQQDCTQLRTACEHYRHVSSLWDQTYPGEDWHDSLPRPTLPSTTAPA